MFYIINGQPNATFMGTVLSRHASVRDAVAVCASTAGLPQALIVESRQHLLDGEQFPRAAAERIFNTIGAPQQLPDPLHSPKIESSPAASTGEIHRLIKALRKVLLQVKELVDGGVTGPRLAARIALANTLAEQLYRANGTADHFASRAAERATAGEESAARIVEELRRKSSRS